MRKARCSLRMFFMPSGGSSSGRKVPVAEGRFCSPPESGASTPDEPTTRIGDEHPDRLRTSGYLNNLSGYVAPIRIRHSYPDTWFLSGCAIPIQMLARGYPQGGHPLPVVSTGHHLALSSLLMMVRDFVYDTGFHHRHPSSNLTP